MVVGAPSEIDEVVERAVGRVRRVAQDGPVVQVVVGLGVLERPAEVREAEGGGAGDGGELVVVDDDDPAGPDEPAEVDEVEEDAVEPVVAVDEREVEAASLTDEARQGELRLLFVELDKSATPASSRN